ncbi:MAG TPA: hypothetical protein H9680_04475 [Firmicutes bacterium]|nr:hypothetical protein [Bacillota bacterium]
MVDRRLTAGYNKTDMVKNSDGTQPSFPFPERKAIGCKLFKAGMGTATPEFSCGEQERPETVIPSKTSGSALRCKLGGTTERQAFVPGMGGRLFLFFTGD